MRLLVVGDMHVKNNNINQIDSLLEKITNTIQNKNPDYVVLLGDLVDSHETMHLQTWNRVLNILCSICELCKVIYVVGNHDMLNNQQFLNDNNWFHVFNIIGHDRIIVANKPIEIGNCIFTPYVFNGRFEESLKDIDLHGKSAIFCHQEFSGAQMQSIESKTGDAPLKNIPIISGHIHDRQIMSGSDYYVNYIGSPIDTSFVAPVKRYMEIIDVGHESATSINFDSIEIKNIPRKILIKTNVEDFENINIKEDENQYKIKIIDSDVNIFRCKNGKKFKSLKLLNNISILFKTTNLNQVQKNIKKDNDFMNILTEDIKNEDESVQKVFKDVYNRTKK